MSFNWLAYEHLSYIFVGPYLVKPPFQSRIYNTLFLSFPPSQYRHVNGFCQLGAPAPEIIWKEIAWSKRRKQSKQKSNFPDPMNAGIWVFSRGIDGSEQPPHTIC